MSNEHSLEVKLVDLQFQFRTLFLGLPLSMSSLFSKRNTYMHALLCRRARVRYTSLFFCYVRRWLFKRSYIVKADNITEKGAQRKMKTFRFLFVCILSTCCLLLVDCNAIEKEGTSSKNRFRYVIVLKRTGEGSNFPSHVQSPCTL